MYLCPDRDGSCAMCLSCRLICCTADVLEFGDAAVAILASTFSVCVTITADAGYAAAYSTLDRLEGFDVRD